MRIKLNNQVIFSQSSDLMERQSSAASSTEETSGAQQDLSGGSRRDDGQPDFGVFKDFDFLEYESESIEGESTDNFNWGVRRRPLSDGDSEPITGSKGMEMMSLSNTLFILIFTILSYLFVGLVVEESLSEKTPILNNRRRVSSLKINLKCRAHLLNWHHLLSRHGIIQTIHLMMMLNQNLHWMSIKSQYSSNPNTMGHQLLSVYGANDVIHEVIRAARVLVIWARLHHAMHHHT